MTPRLDVPLTPVASRIIEVLAAGGGRPLVVGGTVRDAACHSPSKDIDVEVYHLPANTLRSLLLDAGFRLDLVGQSFAVLKVRGAGGEAVDVNLPRSESKSGRGHRGFDVATDPWLSVEDALRRRDFTMNAMAWDPLTGELIDPFHGMEDIRLGRLRATSPAFREDPLRVLRGMQLAGRFGLDLESDTATMCREMRSEHEDLSIERIWTEWEKWARLSSRPSRGLELLAQAGWLDLYPELAALVGCPQDSEWHPEGDVWTHTLLVCDAAASLAARDGVGERERVILSLAALAHDLGKPGTTFVDDDGRIRSPGHGQKTDVMEAFFDRIGCPPRLREPVLALSRRHLDHLGFQSSRRHVRRLSRDLGENRTSIEMLVRLIEADAAGRPPLPGGLPDDARRMLEVAEEVKAAEAAPRPVLMGRHLIESGIEPGPGLGEWLRKAYDAQLDGEFDDLPGALNWFERNR
jgi:tRNA nucleotidyltransferase (CCA-adding enzyme)